MEFADVVQLIDSGKLQKGSMVKLKAEISQLFLFAPLRKTAAQLAQEPRKVERILIIEDRETVLLSVYFGNAFISVSGKSLEEVLPNG